MGHYTATHCRSVQEPADTLRLQQALAVLRLISAAPLLFSYHNHSLELNVMVEILMQQTVSA